MYNVTAMIDAVQPDRFKETNRDAKQAHDINRELSEPERRHRHSMRITDDLLRELEEANLRDKRQISPSTNIRAMRVAIQLSLDASSYLQDFLSKTPAEALDGVFEAQRVILTAKHGSRIDEVDFNANLGEPISSRTLPNTRPQFGDPDHWSSGSQTLTFGTEAEDVRKLMRRPPSRRTA